MNSVQELLDTVINNDYCIGCGLCASLSNSPFEMKLNEDGKYQPIIVDNSSKNMEIEVLSVCPFSKENNKETEIGKNIFGHIPKIQSDEYSGYFLQSYAGYVYENDYRTRGSSGGMGNWIAAQLLNEKHVDGIIHVKSNKDDKNILFDFQVSKTIGDLSEGAKSKYYPVEMSQVLKFVKENPGKYALIGIPCYIKGIRLLAEQDQIINERIKFLIGLVCGHLKSDMFAKSIGWQLGIQPENLLDIDFRKYFMEKQQIIMVFRLKEYKMEVKLF